MAYQGTTAATTLANPPIWIGGALGGISEQSTGTGGGRSVWLYNSSHSSTQCTDTSFFTDAKSLGMKAGDIVIGASATGSSIGVFMGVLGTVSTAGAALTSTGGILSSTR